MSDTTDVKGLVEQLWVADFNDSQAFRSAIGQSLYAKAAAALEALSASRDDWHKVADIRSAEINRLVAQVATIQAENERLKGVISQHELCHDQHGKVNADDFAKGCAAEQRRIYGCAPDADQVAALKLENKRLRIIANSKRCPECNAELSACGEMTADGPELDCRECQLRATVAALTRERDEARQQAIAATAAGALADEARIKAVAERDALRAEEERLWSPGLYVVESGKYWRERRKVADLPEQPNAAAFAMVEGHREGLLEVLRKATEKPYSHCELVDAILRFAANLAPKGGPDAQSA